MKIKTIYVLWSGGLDSTYLIQKLLDENPNHKVIAGYVELANNSEKVLMEKGAIQKMLPLFRTKYGNRFEYPGVVLNTHIRYVGNISNFHQMPIWINAIISTCQSHFDEVAIGYVMNDDAISYIADLKKILKSYKAICRETFPKITFPLMKCKKIDFVDILHEDLKKHVVWCECPIRKFGEPVKADNNEKVFLVGETEFGEFEHCGTCIPCSHSPLVKKLEEEKKKAEEIKRFIEIQEKASIKSEFVEVFNKCKTEEIKNIVDWGNEVLVQKSVSVQLELF